MYGTFTYMNDWFVYGKLVGKSTVCPMNPSWVLLLCDLILILDFGTGYQPGNQSISPSSQWFSGFLTLVRLPMFSRSSAGASRNASPRNRSGPPSSRGPGPPLPMVPPPRDDLFGKRCSKRKWCWLFGCVCRLDILINLYIIHIIHTTYIYIHSITYYVYILIYIYIHIYIYICIWNMHFGKVFHWSLSKFVIVGLQEGTESPQTNCKCSEKMSMKFIYFYQVPCIFGAQTSTCHVITEFFQSPGASRQWANASLHPRVWMLNQHIQWKS